MIYLLMRWQYCVIFHAPVPKSSLPKIYQMEFERRKNLKHRDSASAVFLATNVQILLNTLHFGKKGQ